MSATLERLVRATQAQARVPALSVALHRSDRPLWTFQVGTTGSPAELVAGTRFRLGSITKTFTAVLVLQCRDDGLLGLDDPIGAHLPVRAHGELTVRRLLSHTSGIQREPFGDVWDTLLAPDAAQLVDDLVRIEHVLPSGRRFHYSNVGPALLGLLVARLRGGSWAEVLGERILAPLKLSSVGVSPDEHTAQGFLVDAYSDHAVAEPLTDFGAVGPAAQLYGAAPDLARWGAFLADPSSVDPAATVLPPSTVEEMRWPMTTVDSAQWTDGFGLGLILLPQGNRVVHVGHDGAMPGFLAAAYGRLDTSAAGLGTGRPGTPNQLGPGDTPRGCGVAVLGSSGTATAILDLAHELLRTAVAEDPADVEAWRPGEAVPAAYASVLGRWWGEGYEYAFAWRAGALCAYRIGQPAGLAPAVFAPAGEEDVLRTVSGREVGELLRLTRDPGSGAVVRLHWATYRFTRTQQSFEGLETHGAGDSGGR
jgi:CubicO group peptidase (beta-lactamase class C family)